MNTREYANYFIGFVLITLGVSVRIFEPTWVSSVSGAFGGFIGAGVAMIAVNFLGRDNRPDERDFRLAEKSAYRSFQVSFPAAGVTMALLTLTKFSLSARTVVSLLFGLMGVVYISAFFYYRKRM